MASSFNVPLKRLTCGVALTAVILLAGYGIHASTSLSSIAGPSLHDGRVSGGALVIAGGGYVAAETRERFIELAGGPAARIVVIPALDPRPGTEESWLTPWKDCGAAVVELCHAQNREVANSPEFRARIESATGVWFSGGYQELLADRYVDTAVQDALHHVLKQNGVVGGCSAGAAILSRVMIEEGELKPIEARGLGLISNAIIDQHFLHRNRLWRLEQMLEAHPDLIGLGIDEHTALIIEHRTWQMSVSGESYAMVCLPAVDHHAPRIEVLKAGDQVSLAEIQQNHFAYRAPVASEQKSQVVSTLHAD